MDQHHVEHRAEGDGPGYEVRDANPRYLLIFGIVLVIFLTVLEMGELGVYRLFVRNLGPDPAARAPGDIYDQLRLTRETAKKTLTSYGWVDAKAGIVRIPIERAMDLVIERDALKGKGPKSEAELNAFAGMSVEAKAQDSGAAPAPAAETKPEPAAPAAAKPQEKDQKP